MNHTYIVQITHDETGEVVKEFTQSSMTKAKQLESSLWDRIDVDNYTVRTYIKEIGSSVLKELTV